MSRGAQRFTELEGDLWHTVERVGEQLTTEQREVLYAFLESYADIFASSPDDFGRNAQVQHQINTGDAPPIRKRIRRIPQLIDKKSVNCYRTCAARGSFSIHESLGFPDCASAEKGWEYQVLRRPTVSLTQ